MIIKRKFGLPAVLVIFSVIFMFFVYGILSHAEESSEVSYEISSCWWNDTEQGAAIAEWDEPVSKTKYKVRLYKGSTSVSEWVITNSCKYDFSSAIKKKNSTGTYYFTVYPYKGGYDLAVTSSGLEIDSDYLSAIKTRLKSSSSSSSSSQSYSLGPGVASPSQLINPNQQKGWVQTPSGQWVYYNDEGKKITSKWLSIDGKWFYFSNEGFMLTGWQLIDGKWYYMDNNGILYRDTITPDGYQVNKNGEWIENGEVHVATGSEAKKATTSSISDISVSISSKSEDKGVVSKLTISSGAGTIEDISYSSPEEKWNPGTKVVATFTVKPKDGYIFTKSSKVKVSGGTLERSSVTPEAATVTASFYPRVALETPHGVYISESSNGTNLKWTAVKYARRYYIKITQDSTSLVSKYITGTKYDISDYVGESDISIKLYAYGPEKNNYCTTSSAYEIADLSEFINNGSEEVLEGTFEHTSSGKLTFTDKDGNEIKNAWRNVNGTWYYFNGKGYAVGPGWWQDKHKTWFYFDSDHRMCTGTVKDSGKTYLLNNGYRTDLPLGAWVEGAEEEDIKASEEYLKKLKEEEEKKQTEDEDFTGSPGGSDDEESSD